MTIEELNEMEDAFFGAEGDYEDAGAYEEDYAAAEWARRNADQLFSELRRLLTKETAS